MRVWVWEINKARGNYAAAALTDDAQHVLKIAQVYGVVDSVRLGNWWDEVMRGLPVYPKCDEFYTTLTGGLASPMGKVWEFDRNYHRLAVIWPTRGGENI
jgi:hypothetical protein